MDAPICRMAVSKNSLIVCQTNGHVTVLSQDLQETLIHSQSPSTISKVLHAEVSIGDTNARVCIVAELPDATITAFVHTLRQEGEFIQLDTVTQVVISTDVSLGLPRSFSYNGRQLCVACRLFVTQPGLHFQTTRWLSRLFLSRLKV